MELGPEALLGTEGGGLKVALQTLTYGRIGNAAAGVGMAQAAFDRTAAHLSTRVAFGAPLAVRQHWQFLMADRATEIVVQMARDAVQAFGGFGFTQELGDDDSSGPVEALYRDSKIGEIYEGASEVQRWVLARQIFGRDVVG